MAAQSGDFQSFKEVVQECEKRTYFVYDQLLTVTGYQDEKLELVRGVSQVEALGIETEGTDTKNWNPITFAIHKGHGNFL